MTLWISMQYISSVNITATSHCDIVPNVKAIRLKYDYLCAGVSQQLRAYVNSYFTQIGVKAAFSLRCIYTRRNIVARLTLKIVYKEINRVVYTWRDI